MSKEQLTGAELVIRGLEYLNVSTVFGVPGGAILPAYDPLYDSPIRHILARHEQVPVTWLRGTHSQPANLVL